MHSLTHTCLINSPQKPASHTDLVLMDLICFIVDVLDSSCAPFICVPVSHRRLFGSCKDKTLLPLRCVWCNCPVVVVYGCICPHLPSANELFIFISQFLSLCYGRVHCNKRIVLSRCRVFVYTALLNVLTF